MKITPRILRSGLIGALAFTALSASAVDPIVVPRFTHPGTGQTFYFVLTDRFANGSKANDRGGLTGGADVHGFDPTRVSHYHGGDFVGMTAKLDYLQGLGVTSVWVTPPFKNKPVQQGTAGYHGYWITDFLQIDPHLGTNEEYRTFIREAHARGMRVYMDIIVNHTADVIQLQGDYSYRPISEAPYRDAGGRVFDARELAYNGLSDASAFPKLDAARSFPYQPWIPAGEEHVKNPAWLNDVTLYHNRGNTTFVGEDSVHGDFVGLDDVFTEDPRAVRGFIEIFEHWLEEYGIDGYRIDTVRHVNAAFWQAFSPAIRAHARSLGRPDFVQFAEVYNDAGDPAVLSEFSTGTMPIDTTLDFGFFAAARRFVSQGGTSADLADFFAGDDYYIDHDSNVHTTTTFLGNHDAGRFAYFLQQDNPGASPETIAALSKLGHGLLFFARGQPVLYYGDEQGMIGRGGNDMQARETLFASQAPAFRDAPLLATSRTGADDKFDTTHPFYQLFAQLGALRAEHVALRTGAMIPRSTAEPGLLAFSRIERGEQVEYVAVFNRSRVDALQGRVPTSQPIGGKLELLFSSDASTGVAAQTVAADGTMGVSVAPMQFALWRASVPLAASSDPLSIALVNPGSDAVLKFTAKEVDGLNFPSSHALQAEVSGAAGYAEVTFALQRASRPGQTEYLGTDDTAPYRIFWSPPADMAADEKLTLIASVSDLRGRTAADEVTNVTVAPHKINFGIRDAEGPVITGAPVETAVLRAGVPLALTVAATGTGPLEYQWLQGDFEIPQATDASLMVTAPGHYRVMVRNLAGTTVSAGTVVTEGRE